ncbi:alginate biosynthesis TPR repeat lipoprotein AlgK [Pseudomonas sp. App30]|uniref:alginate biosynthesis TPR repeat lipoprotein AlgK n=1 Tax=Pseudomonas sp. App30 TaxID=3068990 RepID=UPI003A804313
MASTLRILPGSALLGLAVAIGLAGCSGLPDQRLANEALKRGDTALAQQNYQQLADLGYTEAQVGLADIQVGTRDPEQLRQAEATYRAAADTSPRAQARLGRLLALKPHPTEAEQREAEGLLKKAFANGEGNTLTPLAMLYLQYPNTFPGVNAQAKINEWQAAGYAEANLAQVLVYRIQGTYDQHLDDVENLCRKALTVADVCYVELATVYQKRQQTDRQQALLAQLQAAYARGAVPAMRVDAVARVLGDATLGQTDEKTAQAMLEKIAPVYPASWVSLAQLLYDFPELGDVDKMMEYLDKGRNADQPRAELLLGKVYYEGKLVIPDAKKAEQHLKAAAPTQISAHYYLGQIYRRGYLGEPEPQKAVDNLLMAARGGQASADFALAQLYSGGRGTQPNPVYAYMFVQLAKAQPEPAQPVLDLATQLETTLTPDQRAQAQQLLQQEQHVRGAMNQNSSIALQTLEDEDAEDKSL